jgi:hypothetical protein
VLDGAQHGVVVGRGGIAKPAWAVAGDDDGGHLTAARPGVAAAGIGIAAVVGDSDDVVALGPERGIGDLAHQLPQVPVADRDQMLILRIADVAAVEAVRRIPVHVVAFVGDDVAETRHVAAAQIGGELLDRYLVGPVVGV